MTARPWNRTPMGLRLMVRLTPRAGRDALGGLYQTPQGAALLVARVTAPPVADAANAALVKLVAKTLHVAKSTVAITAGESVRIKTLEITGDAETLERALRALA